MAQGYSGSEGSVRELTLDSSARPRATVDAVVQCDNMGFIDVAEKLEPTIGIPILDTNAARFWYALREDGFTGPLAGGGSQPAETILRSG